MSRTTMGQVPTSSSASASGNVGGGRSGHRTMPSGALSSPAIESNRRSCITCHRRKTKCDKTLPCSSCEKLQFECNYPISRRQQRARVETQAALKCRIENLESLVDDLRSHVNKEVQENDATLPPSMEETVAETTQVASRDLGRLVGEEGQGRYMENSFWALLSEKVDNIRSLIDDCSGVEGEEEDYIETQPTPDELSSSRSHQGFMFGFSSLLGSLSGFHPSGSQIFFLWNIFASNVDPLVRILHKPGMQRELMKISENPTNELSKPLEALLFAVYFAGVTSMAPEDCRISFQEERHTLLSRYRFAVQQALARANFLGSRSLVTLQALLIYLACERGSEDSSLVWAMIGVAVRIAQSLGLHRDGTTFKLSPFKTEIRRRIWWQLCLLDVRTAENHGTNQDIAQRDFDTKLPLNIEDRLLNPHSAEIAVESTKFTEMTVSLVRYEIITLLRCLRSQSYATGGVTYTPSSEEIDKKTEECKRRLQEKYLRYCDPKIPLHLFTITVARMMVARMWINVHHPLQLGHAAGSTSGPIRECIFRVSLEIVRAWLCLDTERTIRQWRWAFQNYIPWQALAFILSELCIQTQGTMVDNAWTTAREAFNSWTKNTTDKTHNLLWIRMKKLMAMAEKARASAVSQATSALGNPTTLDRHLQDSDGLSVSESMYLDPEAFSFLGGQQIPHHATITPSGFSIDRRSSRDAEQQAPHWYPDNEALMGDFGTNPVGNPFELVRWATATGESDTTVDNTALFDELDNWW